MTKATLKGIVLAQSNDTIIVEGNHYFPPSSVNKAVLTDSDTQYVLQRFWFMVLMINSLKHNVPLERVGHLLPLILGVSDC